jgi:hypothetical protein
MELVGYSGKMFGNIVDIAFRNVIPFYWLNNTSATIPLPNVDANFWSWTLTVQWESSNKENGTEG